LREGGRAGGRGKHEVGHGNCMLEWVWYSSTTHYLYDILMLLAGAKREGGGGGGEGKKEGRRASETETETAGVRGGWVLNIHWCSYLDLF